MAYQRRPLAQPNMPSVVEPQPLPDDPAAATIREVSGWWLISECSCRRVTHIALRYLCGKLHPENPTVGEVAPRLKCQVCGARPVSVDLTDEPRGQLWFGKTPIVINLHIDR